MSEHAVATRQSPVAAAPARVPQPPTAERTPERGSTTRDRLAIALAGPGVEPVATRDRVGTSVVAEAATPPGARHATPVQRSQLALAGPARPASPTRRPPPTHPQTRPAHDGQRGPARSRAPPPRVFTKLHVTDPADAWEVHADDVAALVLSGAHEHLAAPTGHAHGTEVAASPETQEVVERALTSGGSALPDAVRRRVEPLLQADLSGVRVRHDATTVTAARALGARAFTVGRTIHLGPGASPHDLALMAHEATHVVHQGLAPARAPPVVMRSVSDYLPDVSISDVIPDSVLDGVRSLVREIPGYTALTYVVGQDLLTDEAVHLDVDALIDAVLSYGPFGPAVATVLRALSIAQDIYTAVTDAFGAHDLTMARMSRDIGAAWEELSVTNGIDGNVAIVRRYVEAILRDLRAMVGDVVDQVLTLVRQAVLAVAEPFLQRPEVAPVWNLAKEVLHYDPLLGVEMQVPTAQIIADFLTLIGQSERLEQMRQRGTLQETADWLDTQFAIFRSIVGEVGSLFSEAWDAIQPANLPSLLDTLPALADRAIGVVRQIADFATTLIAKVLELVKKALLGWLSEHAHRVPGFHMLTVIIGKNPFTGEDVPRTAANLIKGFITLLPNGEATYDELEKSGVVPEAAGRIEAAMVRLGISWEMVVSTFQGVWDTLSLDDLLAPIAAFERVVAQFGQPLARIIEFVGVVLQVVVELVLRLMNFPTELLQHVISNAMQAIADIRRDPVGFLHNVMAALKMGFSNFFDHIGGYLLDGLVAWLFRGLGQIGIHVPSDFSLSSIIGLVLDVLGLSIEHLWTKLGEHIGPEKVVLIRGAIDTIGGAWQFVADVQREGLPAIWRYVESKLSGLWQMLLDAALSWIERIVVQQAMTKLLSFLDPTGIMAVINSAIAIFNAIQSAIEYIRDLLQVLDRYVSTLAAVAAGNVVPGAQMLEQGLAAIIPIAIGFLANQVGLGNIPEKIVEIIGGLRRLVDEAIDWLIEQALRLGRAALDALGLGPAQPASAAADPEAIDEDVPLGGVHHHLRDDGPNAALELHSDPVLVNSIQDAQLQGLMTQYNAATTKAAKKAIARQVAAWIRDNMPATGPGGSAPNIGATGRHGVHPPSIIDAAVPLWSLRSEHIVPWAIIRHLWRAMGTEGHASREELRSADNALTTIMIYLGAGLAKDTGEAGRRTAAEAHLVSATHTYAVQIDADTPAADAVFRSTVMTYLHTVEADFAAYTWQLVQAEHATATGNTTHGALRAEQAAKPSAIQIAGAAATEMSDAEHILDLGLDELRRDRVSAAPAGAPST